MFRNKLPSWEFPAHVALDDVILTPREYEELRQMAGLQPARVKDASGAHE